MRTYLECVPCFVRQCLDASRMASDDEAVHEAVLRETLLGAAKMPFDRSPPWMGQRIHRLIRDMTGDDDPYRKAKRQSNQLALDLYPELKARVADAECPFEAAVRLAIASNIIDLGCNSGITDDEIRRAINAALTADLNRTGLEQLRDAIDEARSILYLADNAGEIVLDRLLIEELPRDRVTLVVRGSPVINDATREDAEAAGLTEIVPVMDNGSDVPGTLLESCSPAFRDAFDRCDLVIAKGQGNYETLSGAGKQIFFLLQAKCEVIARHIGCETGQMVIARSTPTHSTAYSSWPDRFSV